MPFSIQSMIETITQNEKDSGTYLKMCCSKLNSPGLTKLLMSIAEQENEHEIELRELLSGAGLPCSFAENTPAEINPASFTDLSAGKINLTTMGLLSFLLEYYQTTVLLYSKLARNTFDTQLQIFFKRLAEEETKILHWIRDRSDLEALQ